MNKDCQRNQNSKYGVSINGSDSYEWVAETHVKYVHKTPKFRHIQHISRRNKYLAILHI